MNETCYGHPTEIKKICEWTGKEFVVDWKHRNRRFYDKQAMYEWRKAQNHEMVACPTCGKLFDRYKNILHPRSGKLTQYCSNECSAKSIEKRNNLQKWILTNNPMNNPSSVDKIKQSKLERYGLPYYNNQPKMINTNMEKYGVPYTWYLPKCKSNGNRVSGFQKRIFIEIKQKYPDAELEKYLPDVQKAVDIYIPSIKKVIECHGDYWHCNPTKCAPDYYNKVVHLKASEIWTRDKQKEELLKNNGYDVEIEIFNEETGDLILSYKLNESFPKETAVQIGSLIHQADGDWIFEAVGVGYELELGAFIEGYTS